MPLPPRTSRSTPTVRSRPSPPTSSPGAVEVAVTTPGGQSISTASDRFTYIACVVPMLKGKTLKKARKRTKANDCRLGKVKGPRSGKVEIRTAKARHPPAAGRKREDQDGLGSAGLRLPLW